MKLLILGPQCAGKTTVAAYLRAHTDLHLVEIDEEILKLNGGTWPKDDLHKEEVLEPQILDRVALLPMVIFFVNHLHTERTIKLRNHDFYVIALKAKKELLLQRNQQRMAKEGYPDASIYIDSQLSNIAELQKQGLIDRTIDAAQPTTTIAREIIAYFQHTMK